MYFSFLLSFLFAIKSTSKPFQRGKRYDIDCNGIPDWCYFDGFIARCMQSDRSWTSFPASTSISCSIAKDAGILQSQTSTSFIILTSVPDSMSSMTVLISTISPLETTTATTATTTSAKMTGSLPAPADFKADKGRSWHIELQGNLVFTAPTGNKNIRSDKGRTGNIGDTIIWNFGDMQCAGNWTLCGFSMGPAFYGTGDVMVVNASSVTNVQSMDFVQAWSGDTAPEPPQWAWGMDTSNVAEINSTHGVAFAWESWRGAPGGLVNNRGNAVVIVTLGADKPIAQRIGPLLTGPDCIALGLLAILRDGDYIYTYSPGGPSNIVIGRAPADDLIHDATKHEVLLYNTNDTWVAGIPLQTDMAFGATTVNHGGKFGCDAYGSVFFNAYLQKYIILCNVYMSFVNMYIADTPYGPWSAEYSITSSGEDGLLPGSYGSHAHPEYGDGKEWYFSIGPNGVFQMFKVTFEY